MGAVGRAAGFFTAFRMTGKDVRRYSPLDPGSTGELDPFGALFRAAHGGLDELHALHAVGNGRKIQAARQPLAGHLGSDGPKRLAVDVAQGLQVTLGMARRGARGGPGGGSDAASSAPPNLA